MKCLTKRLAVCIENDGTESSLIPGKIYQVIPDARAAKDDFVRTIALLERSAAPAAHAASLVPTSAS